MAIEGRAAASLRPLAKEAIQHGYHGAGLQSLVEEVIQRSGMLDEVPEVRFPALSLALHACNRVFTSHL